MPTRPSRLERITNLVLALLETSRPLSLREIGSVVAGYPPEPGALRQAFERDKRTLRDGGIPIAVERLDNDDQVGYRILPEEYYLPDLALEDDELEALAFALVAVRLEGSGGQDVASKLGLGSAFELPPIALLPSLPALGALQEAIRIRALVRFSYHSRLRSVEGHGLLFREGAWYLVGRDQSIVGDDQRRTFRVDRISGDVEVLEAGSYELKSGQDVAKELTLAAFAAGVTDERATRVVLDVDAREVGNVAGLLGRSAITLRRDDGSCRFEFAVGDDAAFVSYVLGLGDAAEVIAPTELRELVIGALQLASAKIKAGLKG